MVLDAGRIVSVILLPLKKRITDPFFVSLVINHPLPATQVEFDKPSELLKKENSRFRSLVDESGDRDLLYAIANKAGTGTAPASE